MYGLPQAQIIAQQLLEKRLAIKGYQQSTITPGFYKHDWRPISFTLCVDDFGVKYTGKVGVTLVSQSHGTIPSDRFISPCQATVKKLASISIILLLPNHNTNLIPVRSAHMEPNNNLSKPKTTQQYSPNPTKPSSKRSSGYSFTICVQWTAPPTQNTLPKIQQFLDYAMMHQDAMITYRASNMILAIHSDASHRAGGIFFLSEDNPSPCNNGAILTLGKIIKPVMSSAAETELGALYINAREVVLQQHLLSKLGHPQPPNPIQINNSTALGVVTNIIQPKHTKAMDMRFHWLRRHEDQKQFRTYWHAGATKLADYVTKHHPFIHHQSIHHTYLTQPRKLLNLRHKAHTILKISTPLPILIPHACAP
eukprot:CCRYP_007096-RA/>CCRYP_007096-RA protein AED:0.31 eAED:0.29 QI:0/0/0/1/0/0/3/0/365